MNKERELEALSEILLILTVEMQENPTFAIKDSFKYIHREFVTTMLASEAAYYDFFKKTGHDIRRYNWYGGKVATRNGDILNINTEYTAEHMQTGKQFKTELFRAYKDGTLTKEYIKSLLKNRFVCWVTKEEDQRLKRLGYNADRPDPEKAYREAGIVIYRSTADNASAPVASDKMQDKTPLCETAVKKNVNQVQSPISYCSKNTFTFLSEERFNKERNRSGFTTLDNEGRVVAVASMHTDKRGPAYEQAELCFFDEYVSEFGQWRLVSINKERLSFNKLIKLLEENDSCKLTIDPRKGS